MPQKCKCGCGQEVNEFRPGKFRSYVTGHNSHGEGNPFYGKHHSGKTKKRLSESRKNIKISEETRKKLALSSTGRVKSEETRKKLSAAKTGSRHHNWNGGIMVKDDGRVFIRVSKKTYKARARIIMEETLGRALSSQEIVHHINGDPSDDSAENLMITNRAVHVIGHHTGTKRSQLTRERIGAKSRGRFHSDETKMKISKSLKEGRYGKNK